MKIKLVYINGSSCTYGNEIIYKEVLRANEQEVVYPSFGNYTALSLMNNNETKNDFFAVYDTRYLTKL